MANLIPDPTGIMERCRERAAVAADHPTWSVAYAEDVPVLLAEIERLVLAMGARNTEAELTWIEENGRLQAIIDVLLPVAQTYVDAFRDDEKMTMPERLRLQQVEDILNDPENWSPADPIGGE